MNFQILITTDNQGKC